MTGSLRCERGAVTIVVAASMVVVMAMLLGAVDLWHVLAARSHAQTAADAGALAAAQDLAFPVGDPDPVASASEYVERNEARLVSCGCVAGAQEAIVVAVVEVGPLALFPDSLTARATARAVVDAQSSGVGS